MKTNQKVLTKASQKGLPMMDCDKFRSNFSSYLDGELSSEQRKALDTHFTVCPSCQEIFRQMRIIQQSLKQLPQISSSPDFEQRLRQQIFNSEKRAQIIPFQFQNWKLPAMGSAIVLATLGLFFVFNNTTDTSQIPVNSPASTQISVGKSSTGGGQALPSQSGKTTLIPDSSRNDTSRIKQEGFLQVGGNQ
ncbi:MAG: zf-HC2 domain-containing protein [Calditrichia bacterium]|jgi:predicted anti-sigma-YlaC factor YlaD